jgi:predicted RNA-binding Zn-ribbon protein involved in translation (DUF1610 family)
MAICFSCGTELPFDNIFRTTECPGCGKGVKVCKNCEFYSPGAHLDCRETISEAVRDKEMVNFCEYFKINRLDKNTSSKDTKNKTGDKARSVFDDLFKG